MNGSRSFLAYRLSLICHTICYQAYKIRASPKQEYISNWNFFYQTLDLQQICNHPSTAASAVNNQRTTVACLYHSVSSFVYNAMSRCSASRGSLRHRQVRRGCACRYDCSSYLVRSIFESHASHIQFVNLTFSFIGLLHRATTWATYAFWHAIPTR